MSLGRFIFLSFLFVSFTEGLDPFLNLVWNVSYITVAPLGVKQQVIAINGQFPGPIINSTTNHNLAINVLNSLDEDLLFTWNGIQQRRTSWQDGVSGTNCPIPPKWNWTYNFQVKDQIGSFFYFPSLGLQRASGGYGGLTVTDRAVIAVPFGLPDGDITMMIGDWYNAGHKALRVKLDKGHSLGMPDGVLINGKGPYPYNSTLVPKGILWETFNVEPGKTYRIRVSNVGTSTALNFRIQNHNLLMVETEGSYVSQQNYSSGVDIHVGQSYSFLVTMDQNASSDYYVVASSRFVNATIWSRVTGVAILHYANSKGRASGPLPLPPDDQYDPNWSVNQARSIRWNLTAGAARPNPQGSYHYGQINVTQTLLLLGSKVTINEVTRYALNDVSYRAPKTPLKLADYYNLTGVFKLDTFPDKPSNRSPSFLASVISVGYKGFLEIVFQNNDDDVQSYHLDGYAFFVVGFESGTWTELDRGNYNKWDGVARSTTQVFPHSWTAVYVSLDNVGMWNLRSQLLTNWYLGQEMYIRVYNPDNTNKTEAPVPDNAIHCGRLANMQKTPTNSTKYEKGNFLISPCKNSVYISFCNQSSSTSPFASHRLPDGAVLNLCWGPADSSKHESFLLSASSSYAGLEVMQLDRKLIGNGAHRELKSSLTVRLHKLDECHMVIVERLPSGVFADMFELEGLVARAVYEEAVIYGDHNLELPALHSSESMVVLHTKVKTKLGHPLHAEISLPLHARYPPLSLESHVVVDLTFPYLLFQCFERSGNASASEKMAWALLTMKDSSVLDLPKLQWVVPAGNPRHAGIVAAITAFFSLVGVVVLWVVSMYSYQTHKLKVT